MSHTADSLPALGLLASLTVEERAALFPYGTVMRHQKGDVLVQQGQPQGYLRFVLQGELRVFCASEEAIVTLGYAQPGECVGEMSVLEHVNAGATVVACSDVAVWAMAREDMDRFADDQPRAACHLFRGIAILQAQRLRTGSRRLLTAEG